MNTSPRVENVPADGNCFFYAVAKALLHIQGQDIRRGYKALAAELREKTASKIESVFESARNLTNNNNFNKNKAKEKYVETITRILSSYEHLLEHDQRYDEQRTVEGLLMRGINAKPSRSVLQALKRYFSDLRKDCTWVGSYEIKALAQVLMQDYRGISGIRVIAEHNNMPIGDMTHLSTLGQGEPVELVHTGNHFKVILPLEEPITERKTWEGVQYLEEPVPTSRWKLGVQLRSSDLEDALSRIKKTIYKGMKACISIDCSCARIQKYDFVCTVVNNQECHWVAYFVNNVSKYYIYFDPFGEEPPEKVKGRCKHLLDHCQENKYNYYINEVRYQRGDGTECGVWAIWFAANVITSKLKVPFTNGKAVEIGTKEQMEKMPPVDKKGLRELYFKKGAA